MPVCNQVLSDKSQFDDAPYHAELSEIARQPASHQMSEDISDGEDEVPWLQFVMRY